jgi:hypothetical protein
MLEQPDERLSLLLFLGSDEEVVEGVSVRTANTFPSHETIVTGRFQGDWLPGTTDKVVLILGKPVVLDRISNAKPA